MAAQEAHSLHSRLATCSCWLKHLRLQCPCCSPSELHLTPTHVHAISACPSTPPASLPPEPACRCLVRRAKPCPTPCPLPPQVVATATQSMPAAPVPGSPTASDPPTPSPSRHRPCSQLDEQEGVEWDLSARGHRRRLSEDQVRDKQLVRQQAQRLLACRCVSLAR